MLSISQGQPDNLVQQIQSGVLRQIPIDPNALAWNSLPDAEYLYNPKERETDYFLTMGGEDYFPLRIVWVGFEIDVTVGKVNAFLKEWGAIIVGSYPGDEGFSSGLTLVLPYPLIIWVFYFKPLTT